MLIRLILVIDLKLSRVKLVREFAGQKYSGQTIKFTLALKFERFGFLFDLYSSFRPKPATADRRRGEATRGGPRNKHAGDAPAARGLKACGGRRHGAFATQLRAKAAPARPAT